MAFTYLDLQNETKRRAIRNQDGTEYDTATQNIINTSLFRLSREAMWKPLRRKKTFPTVGERTSGTVSATANSNSFTGSSLNLITNNVHVGRRMDIQGSSLSYIVRTITGENAFTTDKNYDGTTASGLTYTLFGQEEYNLPVQSGRVAFLWHEEFGYPFVLGYVPDRIFYTSGVPINTGDIPTIYRMWGEDDIVRQPIEGSVLTISSSVSADTSKVVTVYGTVSGYPDFETITTNGSNGTTPVPGLKTFTNVERIDKDSSTTGRITVTSNSANVTVAVLPVGDSTSGIQYKKVQLFPLPTTIFDVNAQVYKDPWRLVNNNDTHELGQDFDEAIILLSVAKIKAENSQQEAEKWFELYEDEVNSLKRVNADKLDYFPTLRRPSSSSTGIRMLHPQVSFNQVGGLYGPSYWF